MPLDEITDLTFSGEEPMEQASALTKVVRLAGQRRDLNIICFGGYKHETIEIRQEEQLVHQQIQITDVLIDGPYVQVKNDSIGLRGSSNQRVIHLTNRLIGCPLETQAYSVEFKIEDGSLTLIGIPSAVILSMFREIFPTEASLRSG